MGLVVVTRTRESRIARYAGRHHSEYGDSGETLIFLVHSLHVFLSFIEGMRMPHRETVVGGKLDYVLP